MDDEQIDIALLYPTIGICWEGIVTEPALANAYTRAYNRYIVDFCSHDPERLVPVAHISLLDPEFAVDEATRAREAGLPGRLPLARHASPGAAAHLTDPAFDPFWAAVADLDMPVGFHVVVRDRPFFRPWMPGRGAGSELFFFAFLAIDVMAAFTQMLAGGVFEKHPKLRCTVLESGATWISAWLDRMDHKYEVMQNGHADRAEAERVLLPAVHRLGRSRRDGHRADRRGRRRRLLRVGVGLPPHRRQLRRGRRDPLPHHVAVRRGPGQGAWASTPCASTSSRRPSRPDRRLFGRPRLRGCCAPLTTVAPAGGGRG